MKQASRFVVISILGTAALGLVGCGDDGGGNGLATSNSTTTTASGERAEASTTSVGVTVTPVEDKGDPTDPSTTTTTASSPTTRASATESGTVTGTVTIRSGDCMPGSAEDQRTGCTTRPMATKVHAYQPVLQMSEFPEAFYRGNQRPVASTSTASDGSYELRLSAGRYSVVAEDDGKPYCDSFSAEGSACPVDVPRGGVARKDILVDKATQ